MTPVTVMKALWCLTPAAVSAFVITARAEAEPNRVTFPDIDRLVHYTTVTRGNVTEHIMTTPEALQAVRPGRSHAASRR